MIQTALHFLKCLTYIFLFNLYLEN